MEKLNRRNQIESLSSEQLAQELIKNGYAFSYQAVIDNNITGKKLLNMTWSEKENLHSTMSMIQLTKFWLFVISIQNNPTNFHKLNNLQQINNEVIQKVTEFPKKISDVDLIRPRIADLNVLVVSRDEGENLLKRYEPGSFFFRKSTKFHCVVMVKIDEKKIAHIPVLKDDVGIRLFVFNGSAYFDNLNDMIMYYQMRHMVIKGETVRLKHFLKKL
ncbi:PREDICTED: uncharacterized protein LOC108561159 [Nicrophorus vespilloides]|uniref:Uncharacterized protein LOC108561159 n=1 Tax=Nicrophorus vespilloides TaxID=110193 RepID=A0ABM1MIR1_NICVS|nr:PREDICTED: uncharacterized protein LOC108561159 [Nicrophorus vespilloides]